ncbi:MAG: class I mannose-6-phosphate isomerase [Acholeplasmataceae bacterium]|nr:class I mannose-6-phosphate isomerase [Acholeplasmataceae bacterium]
MSDLLFMTPVFKHRIWGGTGLKDLFGYEIPDQNTGECWCISAHPNGPSTVKGGPYDGMPLDVLFDRERHLFGEGYGETFPLLVKLLDAKADLSVQVHPKDRIVDNQWVPGKSECWYVLKTDSDGAVILGHRASSKAGFEKLIKEGRYDDLLIQQPIKQGDVIDVPAGTVHAILKNTMVLETQQSSDVTYRLYDYDRKDASGKKRDLHLEDALLVATIPHQEIITNKQIIKSSHATITRHINNAYFELYECVVEERLSISHERFLLMSCLEGQGLINGSPFTKGDHLIKTIHTNEVVIEGHATWILSAPHLKNKEVFPHEHLEFR